MSSKQFSRLSQEDAAELLAGAANPLHRQMNQFGPPRGTTANENFRLMLDLILDLEAIAPLKPDRSLPIVKSFIL